MALSGIGGGNSGIMAQAQMKIRAGGNADSADAVATGTSGMSAGSLSAASAATASPALSGSSAAASTSNMMSDFFVKNTIEQSRYVQATLDNLDLAAQMRENLKADSFTLIDAAGGLAWEHPQVEGGADGKYTDAVLKQLEVDRLAKNEKETETIKASEQHLQETRDDIEQAADEATQGTDAADTASDDSGDKESGAEGDAAEAVAAEASDARAASAATPEDVLLEGSRDGTGNTVVEAVEKFQAVSAEQAASTVGNASEEQATAQAEASSPALGSRLDVLV